MNETFERIAADAARAGGQLAKTLAREAASRFSSKADGSIVTFADPLVEDYLRKFLLERLPEAGFMGEESGGVPAGLCWVVDPIDGTSNFAAGLPFWCVSAGLLLDGVPVAGAVHDPNLDETFSAAAGHGARLNGAPLRPAPWAAGEGFAACLAFPRPGSGPSGRSAAMVGAVHAHRGAIRSQGAGALSTCYVAAGRQGMFAEPGIHLWDVAAAQLVVAESGGSVSSGWSVSEPSGAFPFCAWRNGLDEAALDVVLSII